MKPIASIILAALCAPATLFAQELSKEPTAVKPPSFVIGGNLGLVQSHDHYYEHSAVKPTAGVFARYYMGKHLAVESGIRFTSFGPRTIQLLYREGHQRVTAQTLSIPINFQYHLLSRASRVRPYFGVGAGITRKDYQTVFMDRSGIPGNEIREAYNDPFFRFTQGVTWQVNKNLQINQSVYYQKDIIGNFGMEIGVGYTIR